MNGFFVPIMISNTARETNSRPPEVGTGNTSATSAKNTALVVQLLLANESEAHISGVHSLQRIIVTNTTE